MKRERLLMRAARRAVTAVSGLALAASVPAFADDGVWAWPDYDGTGSNGADVLFSLINNGAVLGGVASFQITAGANSGNALFAKTVGTGRAGSFDVVPAAGVVNNNHALFARHTGGGRAGHFEISNASNTADAVWATTNGSGHCVHGRQSGTGRAGFFEIQ